MTANLKLILLYGSVVKTLQTLLMCSKTNYDYKTNKEKNFLNHFRIIPSRKYMLKFYVWFKTTTIRSGLKWFG